MNRLATTVVFDTYVISGGPSPSRGTRSGLLLADNLPDTFRSHYLGFCSSDRDLLYFATRGSGELVRTAEIHAAVEADPLLQDCFIACAGVLGEAAMMVPLRSRGRFLGGIALWRQGDDFTDAEAEHFELLAPALHLAASDLASTTSHSELTARERECLVWTSVGKTAWEIGSILGISEHTAVAHLNSAVRKLNAASRAQAVAEALRRGLID